MMVEAPASRRLADIMHALLRPPSLPPPPKLRVAKVAVKREEEDEEGDLAGARPGGAGARRIFQRALQLNPAAAAATQGC
jgi:hypothetical protein